MKRLLLLACLAPGLASGGNLYRCVGPAGQVSYQSAPCPVGQRTDRTIEFTPDPVLPVAAIASAPRRLGTSKRSGSRHAGGRTRKAQPSPCARAKAKRDAQLERLGFKRTFDDLSRIDAAVRAVCKGF